MNENKKLLATCPGWLNGTFSSLEHTAFRIMNQWSFEHWKKDFVSLSDAQALIKNKAFRHQFSLTMGKYDVKRDRDDKV